MFQIVWMWCGAGADRQGGDGCDDKEKVRFLCGDGIVPGKRCG